MNFQMNELCFKEAGKLPIFDISWKKQRSSRETSTSASRPLTVWITTNCGFLKVGVPDHLTCLLRNLYVDQEATELDMEQLNGSKLGKEYMKVVYCHPACLTDMQSALFKMLG